jgi:hypothetical protein
MELNIIFSYDESTKQATGYFEHIPHVVAIGANLYELTKELFKSLAVLSDYQLRQQMISEYHSKNYRKIKIEI